MDWDVIKPELEQKLDPKHVAQRRQGSGQVSFIEGWHAIAEANEIFGFGGWSYRIKSLTKDSVEQSKDAKGNPQWQAAYTCIVLVEVGNVVREDVGFGSGFAKNIGDAIEGATKEAVTDALKRCLRTFGNRFGLALYDKSRENVGAPRNPRDVTDGLLTVIKGATSAGHLHKLTTGKKYTDARDWLEAEKPPMCAEVDAALASRKQELDPAHQAPPVDDEGHIYQ